jgi:hypothetical protein
LVEVKSKTLRDPWVDKKINILKWSSKNLLQIVFPTVDAAAFPVARPPPPQKAWLTILV